MAGSRQPTTVRPGLLSTDYCSLPRLDVPKLPDMGCLSLVPTWFPTPHLAATCCRRHFICSSIQLVNADILVQLIF